MKEKQERPPAKPRWWLNTYFLFGILLAIIALLGFARGSAYIMDPGQPFTAALPWLYLFASAQFFVNGYVSHRATVRAYSETVTEDTNA